MWSSSFLVLPIAVVCFPIVFVCSLLKMESISLGIYGVAYILLSALFQFGFYPYENCSFKHLSSVVQKDLSKHTLTLS